MSDQTEKASPKPRKAPATKRAPRKTRAAAGGKQAASKTAGQSRSRGGAAAGARGSAPARDTAAGSKAAQPQTAAGAETTAASDSAAAGPAAGPATGPATGEPETAKPAAAAKAKTAKPKAAKPKPAKSPAPKSSAPKSSAAKSPDTGNDTGKGAGRAAQAPDPATVTFGSNRPIVAPPPPKPASSGPVSSGLRFSGPSAGTLKSSGPQKSPAKAEGTTFSSFAGENPPATDTPPTAKAGNGKGPGKGPVSSKATAAAAPKPAAPKPAAPKPAAPNTAGEKPAGEKAATTKPDAKTKADPAAKSGQTPKADGKQSQVKGGAPAGKTSPGDGKTQPIPLGGTKPAIAPQSHGPLIERSGQRSNPLLLLGIALAGIGLAWWIATMPSPDPQAGYDIASRPSANGGTPESAVSEGATSDGVGANQTSPNQSRTGAPGETAALTAAEMREIGDLLRAIGLEPGRGAQEGAALEDAIRSYQEMAGLTVDGQASPALLQDLRAVASLYGGG
ncbi:peptidoglycan-binding domain-containing protein [Pelagibius sp.]|uniref:peptidoglycan-binding domain-containing protein n=1 Tax=Pelagibius sp. TaxID=1931238 RepID=UPI003B50EA26